MLHMLQSTCFETTPRLQKTLRMTMGLRASTQCKEEQQGGNDADCRMCVCVVCQNEKRVPDEW